MIKKPNILLLFADDERFDTIHALGNDEIITPNLDNLVSESISFTKAHIMGGTSGAVCMPSRAMLNTGRTLFHLEAQGQSIPEEHTLLGEWLQTQGYRTYGSGKWHNGARAFARSFTDGAEIFFGGMHDHWNVPACDFHPDGNYPENKPAHVMAKMHLGVPRIQTHNSYDHIEKGKHSTEMFSSGAIDFINKYDADNPFYMYVAFMAPHDPRTMPKRFHDMYDAEKITLPENFLSEHPFDNGDMMVRDEKLAPWPRTEDEVKTQTAEYYAMITHMDYEIGHIIDALKQKDVYDNTIIIYAGDNGLAVGRHGLFGKQSLYEHSIRVPLIFKIPGVTNGQKSEAYAYILDIFPTICDVLGMDAPDTVEGISLFPVIKGDEDDVRDTVFCAYLNIHRSVRDKNYKLIEYYPNGRKMDKAENMKVSLNAKGNGTGPDCVIDGTGTRTTQLFDIVNDPWEINNLADNPDYADRIETMQNMLTDWQIKLDDPLQTGEEVKPPWMNDITAMTKLNEIMKDPSKLDELPEHMQSYAAEMIRRLEEGEK